MIFVALSIVIESTPLYAFVNCVPTSCSAACDSSCSYQVCGQAATHDIQISVVPYHYVPPADACSGTPPTTISFLSPSQRLGSVTIDKANISVSLPYQKCRTEFEYGPSCPPPPTPAPTP